MQFIAPDVLDAARGLSAGAAGLLVLVGTLLWSCGWRWHRFWVVFGITLLAGVLGLSAGQAAGGRQVMVVGVLVAVSAGMLALELAKILSFVTGGVAGWAAAQTVFPQAQELWAVFLSGGLLGVVLYQFWTMLVTSLFGVLLSWHGLLILASDLGKFDSVAWAVKNSAALNGGVIAVAIIGVLVQVRTARAVTDSEKPAESDDHESDSHDDHEKHESNHKSEKPHAKASSSWWTRLSSKKAA